MDPQLHYALLTAAMAAVMLQCCKRHVTTTVDANVQCEHRLDQDENQDENQTQDHEPMYQYRHQSAYSKRMWATNPEFRAKNNERRKASYHARMQSDPAFAERQREQARIKYQRKKDAKARARTESARLDS